MFFIAISLLMREVDLFFVLKFVFENSQRSPFPLQKRHEVAGAVRFSERLSECRTAVVTHQWLLEYSRSSRGRHAHSGELRTSLAR